MTVAGRGAKTFWPGNALAKTDFPSKKLALRRRSGLIFRSRTVGPMLNYRPSFAALASRIRAKSSPA